MYTKNDLLNRLGQISEAVAACGKARAFLGFGSTAEIERLDDFSDLDFLVVPKQGLKEELIENFDWLLAVAPIAYCHKNTSDGFKLFFEDGIFCEFGILLENELQKIPHAGGRVLWCEPDFDTSLLRPTVRYAPVPMDERWVADEIMTMLYVGLCRYARGEKLSAARIIQRDAADLLLLYIDQSKYSCKLKRDPFQYERRFEKRCPGISDRLADFFQGYERTPESALCILNTAETLFHINGFIKVKIRTFATSIMDSE